MLLSPFEAFRNELEVDLVVGLVSFKRGVVNVEVEVAGVSFRALDSGPKCAVLEAGGGAPSLWSKVTAIKSESGKWLQTSGQ
ncbi:hypothetical protein Vadar_012902 [Vaccinium darrowii]|uniref:Uncharacterized protein n=1 Tax=Vaccinium darrowii TaxID=229202 RepID=A0ACB7ZK77_9ERIC|nr:hypothetical protein Vadar_012902 [Vaccinium darrowii]